MERNLIAVLHFTRCALLMHSKNLIQQIFRFGYISDAEPE